MDPLFVLVAILLFLAAWFQLSIYSFSFNVIACCLVVLILLYFSVTCKFLFPFEKILLMIFYKDPVKSPNRSHFEKELPLDKVVFDDEITRKLRELTGHIVRDFILDWYNTVSDDVNFVQEAFELFEHVISSLRKKVSSVDSEVFLSSILRFSSRHLICYQQAVQYAKKNASHDSQRQQQLEVITYEKLLGHLAMSNYPDTEVDHLRSLTTVLLKALLPSDYHLTGAGLYVVRELIAKNVFFPLVDLLSDPKWVNQTIVHILKDDDPEDDGESTHGGDGSLTSSDYEDVLDSTDTHSSKSSESHIESLEIMDLVEVNGSKPEGDIKVVFSVLQNTDDLDLDLTYDACHSGDDSETMLNGFSTKTSFVGQVVEEKFEPNIKDLVDNEDSEHIDSLDSSMLNRSDNSIDFNYFSDDVKVADSSLVTDDTAKTSGIPRNKDSENLTDHHFFRRVRISKVMTMEEPYEKSNRYTLYVVEYSAPAFTPKSRFLSFTPSLTNKQEQNGTVNNDVSNDIERLHHFQVKRRFREFLNLQERLNENLMIRRLMRDVRGPSRMFPMPIGNMDKDYIEKRRKFLQAYLRQLCFIPQINHSQIMKEFLAYNSDPRIAFVRRQSHYIPRFDKMFKNVVHDLLGAATDHISGRIGRPEEASYPARKEENRSPVTEYKAAPLPLTNPSFSPPCGTLQSSQFTFARKASKENPVTKFKNIFLGKGPNIALYEEGLRDYGPFSGPRNANQTEFGRKWRSPEYLLLERSQSDDDPMKIRRTQGDGCDQICDFKEVNHDNEEDLITGGIFYLVRLIWGVRAGINSMLYLCLGRYVKTFLRLRVHALTRKNQWLFYLKSLQKALWPGGVWGGRSDDIVDAEKEDKYEEALRVLEDTFPDALRYVVGSCRYSDGVVGLLNSFQNPVINRHVIYHLIDILMKFLFPDLPSVIARTNSVSL